MIPPAVAGSSQVAFESTVMLLAKGETSDSDARKCLGLREPQCVAVQIVNVKLAGPPSLVSWTFVNR